MHSTSEELFIENTPLLLAMIPRFQIPFVIFSQFMASSKVVDIIVSRYVNQRYLSGRFIFGGLAYLVVSHFLC